MPGKFHNQYKLKTGILKKTQITKKPSAPPPQSWSQVQKRYVCEILKSDLFACLRRPGITQSASGHGQYLEEEKGRRRKWTKQYVRLGLAPTPLGEIFGKLALSVIIGNG